MGIPEYTFSRAPLANAFSQTAGTDPTTGMPYLVDRGLWGVTILLPPRSLLLAALAQLRMATEFDEDLMNTIVNLIASGSPVQTPQVPEEKITLKG